MKHLQGWHKVIFGARTRVLVSYMVLIVFSTLFSLLTIRHILIVRLEHQIDKSLVQPEIVEISSLTQELYLKASTLAERNWCLQAKGSGRLIADRQRLTQAVLNLAQNATQHTTKGDVIALGSTLTNGLFRFWVCDSGEGIAIEEQERIFQRFARGSGGRRSEGAGLGLAIVEAIAQAHGGWVELSSQPECGSTFTLVIPLDPSQKNSPL